MDFSLDFADISPLFLKPKNRLNSLRGRTFLVKIYLF